MEKGNAIKCERYSDFIDRLICNGFVFEIDLEEHKMYIPSYQWKEETWNDVGFHYHGNAQNYYISINSLDEASDIISDAVSTMKGYIKREVAKKLKDIIENHLGIKD